MPYCSFRRKLVNSFDFRLFSLEFTNSPKVHRRLEYVVCWGPKPKKPMFWSMCKKSLIRWGLVLLLWKIKDTKIPTTSAFHELQWPSLYSGTSGWLISRRKRHVRLNPKPSYTQTIGKSLKNVISFNLDKNQFHGNLMPSQTNLIKPGKPILNKFKVPIDISCIW